MQKRPASTYTVTRQMDGTVQHKKCNISNIECVSGPILPLHEFDSDLSNKESSAPRTSIVARHSNCCHRCLVGRIYAVC